MERISEASTVTWLMIGTERLILLQDTQTASSTDVLWE